MLLLFLAFMHVLAVFIILSTISIIDMCNYLCSVTLKCTSGCHMGDRMGELQSSRLLTFRHNFVGYHPPFRH